MDRKRYFVRPFGEADYEALSRIESKLNPETPSNPEVERQWDRSLEFPHLVHEKWAVEERETGIVVAIAAMNHSPRSYDPRKFWVSVVVDPGHRRRGIGRALCSLLDAEAVAHRATCFWTSIRKDDPSSLEFAGRRGFAELRSVWMSVLDLSQSDPVTFEDRSTSFEKDGIRFTTLSEEGPNRTEVRERLYDLWSEASRDVPRMGDYTAVSFAEFTFELERPWAIPEAFFLARHGDVYVGSSDLERDLARTDSLYVGFTATRASYRGRGIATELKRRSVEYARRHGTRYLRTVNDSLNQPIWAINEKLGFRRAVEWSQQERRFGTEGAAPAAAPAR